MTYGSTLVIIMILLLAGDIEMNPGPKRYAVYKISDLKIVISRTRAVERREQADRKRLFAELPEYIGKECCSKCFTNVDMRHNAIICDLCQQWIHLGCSDMPKATYRQLQKEESFNWNCVRCRQDNEKTVSSNIRPHHTSELTDLRPGSIIHMNCRSANNKLAEIQSTLHKAKPAVLVLTETWLDESCPKGTLVFKGYKHLRKDRSHTMKQTYNKKNGGGIAIIYRDNLKLKPVKELNRQDDEIFWVSTQLNGRRLLIGAAYRPEYCNIFEGDYTLEEHLQNAFQQTQNIVFLGDLNINLLGPTRNEDIIHKEKLEELFDRFNMKQLINHPTRIGSNVETLIDHIWLSSSMSPQNSGTIPGISDHTGIFVNLRGKLHL